MTVRDRGQRGRDDVEVELQIKGTTGNDRVRDEGTQKGTRDIARYEMREPERRRSG